MEGGGTDELNLESETLASIVNRIEELELVVRGPKPPILHSTGNEKKEEKYTQGKANLTGRLLALRQVLQQIELSSIPNLSPFYEKYIRLRRKITWEEADLLPEPQNEEGATPEPIKRASVEEGLPRLAAKASIVCSYEEEAEEVARLTSLLSSLLQPLNDPQSFGIFPS